MALKEFNHSLLVVKMRCPCKADRSREKATDKNADGR